MSSLLQRNTATIQSLINKINNLPEAGGSTPPLCKISLKGQLRYGDAPSFETFIYTTFENNKITAKILTYNDIFGEINDDQFLETKEGEIIALQNSFLTVFSSNSYSPSQNIVDSSNLTHITDYYLNICNEAAFFQVEESPTAYLEFDM